MKNNPYKLLGVSGSVTKGHGHKPVSDIHGKNHCTFTTSGVAREYVHWIDLFIFIVVCMN